jgi:RNA polymerase sigma factor (sigma-70 family)
MQSETTRVSLIRRVQNPDDRPAWGEFWARYEPLLRRYVRRLGVKGQDADDIIQDLFPKLQRLLPGFQLDHDRGQFRGWLRRVTDNNVRDSFRAMQRQRKRELEAADYLAAVQQSLADTPDGEAERNRKWARNMSDVILKQVRQEFAHRASTLACFEETILKQRPAKDVAAELGIAKVNNVYAYASKVFARVKALKKEYDGYDPDDETPDDEPKSGDRRLDLIGG